MNYVTSIANWTQYICKQEMRRQIRSKRYFELNLLEDSSDISSAVVTLFSTAAD